MNNKEAIEHLKELKTLRIEFPNTLQEQALGLAIKALEILDDVNHKIYRNENCPQKHRCYDYQGYHCAGCGWEKKGGAK